MAAIMRRSVQSDIVIGIAAGLVFGIVEIIGSAAMGQSAQMPVRWAASIVMGRGALTTGSVGVVWFAGVMTHLVLSALFGLVYRAVSDRASARVRENFGSQAILGLAYGIAVWVFNFQIIARLLYPWYFGAPQFLNLISHAVFYGIPLALLTAEADRRMALRGTSDYPRSRAA